MTVEKERITFIDKFQYVLELFLLTLFIVFAIMVITGGIFALAFIKGF